MRRLGLSVRTERAYLAWIRRFVVAQGRRHPRELGAPEVEAFLPTLAVRDQVAPATQNQALNALMLGVETLYPLLASWRMTADSFFRRDLPYFILGGLTLGGAKAFASAAIVHIGLERGSAQQDMPLLPAIGLALLIPDFFWYWLHRWSHEARGPIGRWLWRVRVAHHLPEQVNLLMHAVGHPINAIFVRLILTLPLFLLGFSAQANFVVQVIVGLQGLVSHFNVDLRAGWLNDVRVGAELHRGHHSASPEEGKNFGAVVSAWDLLFGTFQYRPGCAPDRVGVHDPAGYPRDRDVIQVLALPLRARRPDAKARETAEGQ